MHDNDKKLLELAEKATPRPWADLISPEIARGDIYYPIRRTDREECPRSLFEIVAEARRNEDRNYIVAAANAVPKLLERIRLLRRHVSYQRYADLSAVRAAQECLAADYAGRTGESKVRAFYHATR